MPTSHLRIVSADGRVSGARAPGELTAQMSLSEFFWEYVWPEVLGPAGDRPGTRKCYRESLGKWARITGDPALDRIDLAACRKFVRMLTAQHLAANTIRKHARQVQHLLDLAGPVGRANRGGANLLESVPWLAPPRSQWKPPRPAPSLEEIHRWLDVARAEPDTFQKKIPGVAAALWWPALILFAYNTALRIDCLMQLRWEMIDGQWLRVPAEIYKGAAGRMFWVNHYAAEAIAGLGRRSGLIFPWTRWPQTQNTLHRYRRRQLEAARVRPIGFHGLRRAFATQCAKISPIAAQIQMGHKGLGMQMMIDHYLDAQEVLSAALERLPQPGPATQQTLF